MTDNNNNMNVIKRSFKIKRGDIYFADLNRIPEEGLISGKRPVLIVQNDNGNTYSPVVTVIPLSTKTKRLDLPTHFLLEKGKGGLKNDSVVQTEQIVTLSKDRLEFYIGTVDDEDMDKINDTIRVQIGI